MSEEHQTIQMVLDSDPQITRLIIETAQYLAKSPPAAMTEAEREEMMKRGIPIQRMDSEDVNEAANLVFLAMSLIAEKRQ